MGDRRTRRDVSLGSLGLVSPVAAASGSAALAPVLSLLVRQLAGRAAARRRRPLVVRHVVSVLSDVAHDRARPAGAALVPGASARAVARAGVERLDRRAGIARVERVDKRHGAAALGERPLVEAGLPRRLSTATRLGAPAGGRGRSFVGARRLAAPAELARRDVALVPRHGGQVPAPSDRKTICARRERDGDRSTLGAGGEREEELGARSSVSAARF